MNSPRFYKALFNMMRRIIYAYRMYTEILHLSVFVNSIEFTFCIANLSSSNGFATIHLYTVYKKVGGYTTLWLIKHNHSIQRFQRVHCSYI